VSTTSRRLLSAERFERMRGEKHFELVDGKLRSTLIGAESSWVAFEFAARLRDHCKAQALGWVLVETAYKCFPAAPDRVRRPDVSFVRAGRLPGERLPEGFIELAPDLAVEVVSPKDRAYDLDEKIEHLLGASVRRIWVLNPKTRKVRVHRPDGTTVNLGEDDELSGEDVVPGFRCRVGDLFPPPA
jgi:Uma2 family endonuclease